MAVTGGFNPVYTPGAKITMALSGTVTAGNLVEVSGDGTVAAASANSQKVVGVALQSGASGDKITVQILGYVVKLVASGAITAGDEVSAAASGKVSTQAAAAGATAADINKARSVIGIALNTISDTNSGNILVGRA